MAIKRKVFGLGLNKTGTTTLRIALERLGYQSGGHQGKLMQAYRRGQIDRILDYAQGFDCFDDWPWPLIYPALFERFGDSARYVLTRRASADHWLTSIKNHAERVYSKRNPRKMIYGYEFPHGVESHYTAVYDRHNRQVRAFFDRDDRRHLLLETCWETGDGWPQLCGFLGEEPPDRPFPHVNSGAMIRATDDELAQNRALIEAQLRALAGGLAD